jgi:hypothetical protein
MNGVHPEASKWARRAVLARQAEGLPHLIFKIGGLHYRTPAKRRLPALQAKAVREDCVTAP